MRTQRTNRNALLGALAATTLLLGLAAPASAAPQWRIVPLSAPTLTPVDFPETEIQDNLIHYYFQVRNFGDSPAPAAVAGDSTNCEPGGAAPANCYEVSLDFPPGIKPLEAVLSVPSEAALLNCPIDGGEGLVTCQVPGDLANQLIQPQAEVAPKGMITAKVTAPPGLHDVALQVSGAGAGSDSVLDTLRVDSNPPLFEVAKFDGQISADPAGAHLAQAGAHPYDFTTSLEVESAPFPGEIKNEVFGPLYPIEAPKDVVVELPAGFVGNPTTAERCTAAELATSEEGGINPTPLCPVGSQVGTTLVRTANWMGSLLGPAALYNMEPPPGIAARFGFQVLGTVVMIDAKLRTEPDYGITAVAHNIVQALGIQGSEVTIWGVPSDESHDSARACPGEFQPSFEEGGPICPTSAPAVPFFRNPTSCTPVGEGLPFALRTHSWQDPGDFKSASFETHEPIGYPADPLLWGEKKGIEDCDKVPFEAKLEAQPTSIDTETASGLEVEVEIPDPHPGPESPEGIANSDIKAVKVSLPAGLTINPSQAEGLGACSPAQYASTELSFFPTPGKGCPDNAKIGTVSVQSPLLEETIPGDVFIAQPFENPFNSLLALYVVLAEPERGILIKLAGKVETNTGQIVTTFEDLPQLPFETFDFKFREGSRAPLVTPAACGTYETTAEFSGYADPAHPLVDTSSFEITRGIGGGPCPPGGLPPFKPGLIAGSINNAAGAFSPFNVRLFRSDAEQEITHFSIKLPPGIVGKLAGVPFCPDQAIEAAKLRSGASELIAPSCPTASLVGRTLVGAGVGSVQTYVPGKVYLAGPYNGSALSVAAITAAKVGPFDLGTVVVRQALKVNPETAEVFIDATGSDPIPHIIDGITTHIRDIRAYVDRPDFTLNPTSCKRTSTASTVLGSGLDFTSAIDDRPVTVTTPYQAANCASLGFKPRLSLSLSGGTKRGQNPALRAVLRPRAGDANASRISVQLPHSEFLDQSHIRTVCTRVQFAAGAGNGAGCPPGAVYGHARAFTPILSEPLEGPVFLRSSSNPLPDLVLALDGLIEFNAVGRIDSVDGGIRNTFDFVPDAPITKVVVSFQGGKKGLLENSTNLCAKAHRAIAKFDAHNGKVRDFNPVLRAKCPKQAKAKAKNKR